MGEARVESVVQLPDWEHQQAVRDFPHIIPWIDATKLERTSYHESGHGVFAVLGNWEIDTATVIPEGDRLGEVRLRSTSPKTPPERPDRQTTLLANAAWTLSGLVAESLCLGRVAMWPAPELLECIDFLESELPELEVAPMFFGTWLWLRKQLGQPTTWAAVERLALYLRLYGTLEGDLVETVVTTTVAKQEANLTRVA